ncbi:hypothetical protein [Mycobacterium sp. SMC-19]|uniref:hypothetical protein n=1 Tax=Mycobacterium sp. SMC-19 TaxID=3381630 RepID=UPI00387652D9
MTTTESASASLTRAEKAALLGGAGGILAGVAHFSGNSVVIWLAIALLAGGAAVGFSSGWVWGLTPQRSAPAAPAGLVGSRIVFGGHTFTVLDDSAVRGDGRRASVVAADEAGQLGALFVGFSADGRVAEARIGKGPWGAAAVVG